MGIQVLVGNLDLTVIVDSILVTVVDLEVNSILVLVMTLDLTVIVDSILVTVVDLDLIQELEDQIVTLDSILDLTRDQEDSTLGANLDQLLELVDSELQSSLLRMKKSVTKSLHFLPINQEVIRGLT